jgi:hypothetical protein
MVAMENLLALVPGAAVTEAKTAGTTVWADVVPGQLGVEEANLPPSQPTPSATPPLPSRASLMSPGHAR